MPAPGAQRKASSRAKRQIWRSALADLDAALIHYEGNHLISLRRQVPVLSFEPCDCIVAELLQVIQSLRRFGLNLVKEFLPRRRESLVGTSDLRWSQLGEFPLGTNAGRHASEDRPDGRDVNFRRFVDQACCVTIRSLVEC
jgi:hypothetical protein